MMQDDKVKIFPGENPADSNDPRVLDFDNQGAANPGVVDNSDAPPEHCFFDLCEPADWPQQREFSDLSVLNIRPH